MRRPAHSDWLIVACAAAASLPAWWPVVSGYASAAVDPASWRDAPVATARWATMGRSAGVAALVACLATLVATPMAQVLRTTGVRAAALLVAPVWIPSWLIYAGLNLARAPDTAFGAAFMRWALDPERAIVGDSNRWAIIALGDAVAIASLVLWSAPVAALVMAGVEDPEHDVARELARTDPIGPLARLRLLLRLRARALLSAWVVVALLTLGSAVPLHLAQVETDAIYLWRALVERPASRWPGVWVALTPHLILALAGAWWITARLGSRSRPGQGVTIGAPVRAGPVTRAAAWGLWSLAVVAPVVLMVWSLDTAASMPRWVRMEADALRTSGAVAAAGAVCAAATGVGLAALAASESPLIRGAARTLATLAVFGALVPGVFVGVGVGRLGLAEWPASVIAAGARTAFVGALAGLVVAASETPDERAGRRLDGAGHALGWLRANPGRAALLGAGAWLGAFVLGLHEIEASVMVRPPGRGNLPQQMLSDLHYARLESLSAGGAVMGVFGIGVGVLAGLVLAAGAGLKGRRNGAHKRIGNPRPAGQ